MRSLRASIRAVLLWAACLVLLAIHGYWFLPSSHDFLTASLLYPVLAGIALFLFTYFYYRPEKRELSVDEQVEDILDLGLLAVPIALTLYACIVAQLTNDYTRVVWVGPVVGLAIGQQVGRLARMWNHDGND